MSEKFRTTYKQMQTEIAPNERLIRKTLSAAYPKHRQRPLRLRTAALAAAVLALLMAVSVPVIAATGVGLDWLYKILPKEQVDEFDPIQMIDEDQGIRVEVTAIHIEDTTTEVYFTMTDLLEPENGIINETVELWDSSWQLLPDYPSTTCEPISKYDPETRTAHFLLTIEDSVQEGHPAKPQTDQLTFLLNSFITGYGRISVELPVIDLTAVETNPEIEIMENGNASGSCELELIVEDSPEFKQDKFYYEFLKPYDEPIPLSEELPGYYLSGLAYRDGELHIQIKDASEMLHIDPPTLHIVKPDGTIMDLSDQPFIEQTCSGSVSTYSRGERSYEYREFVFEVSPEELEDCTIGGNFPVSERVVRGDWEVTFPLKETN